MVLRDFLLKKGLISSRDQTSVCCPFHADRSPSASLFSNSLRCWSQCQRSFGLLDFQALYGAEAQLEYDPTPDHLPEEEGHDKVIMFVGPSE